MRSGIASIIGWVVVAAWSAFGAFVPPTDEQLRQAVADPTALVALLKGASVEQAAATTREVIDLTVAADLPQATRDANLAALVAHAFKAMTGLAGEFAQALGAAMSATAVTTVAPAVLSITQQAVIRAAGAAAGAAFGAAYTQQVVALPMAVPPVVLPPILRPPAVRPTLPPSVAVSPAVAIPARPPVATPYEGQGLR